MSYDPFSPAPGPAHDERTVVRPRPGMRRAPGAALPEHARFGATDTATADEPLVPLTGNNVLLEAAYPILVMVPALRLAATHPDPGALRETLSASLRQFEQAAHDAGITRETVIAARYVLCAFADESISLTPWGGGGTWAAEPLLVRFHSETWGGEKVFQLLSRLAEAPQKNRDLLELIYHCLSLGFAGRYRVVAGGSAQIEAIRERLFQMIRSPAPASGLALSPKWAPAIVERRRWLDATPFWVFCGLIAILSLAAFVVYDQDLARRSDPVFSAIRQILPGAVNPTGTEVRPPAAREPTAAPAGRRLAPFLQPEIEQGLVSVRDGVGQSVVTIRGDGLFASGSAQIARPLLAVIDRVAAALGEAPGGKVMVSGHTDNLPIRSARFPSNWDLSLARAQAVRERLATRIPGDRIQAQGRAELEPIAPNDTTAGRSQNRRIEITLYAKP